MKIDRRGFGCLAAAVLLWTAATPSVLAQTADRPIRMLVGFPAGGSTDALARLLAEGLGTELGTTVIVENRGGAGGLLALQALKAAQPDGSTVMLTIEHTQVLIPLTTKAPGFDPINDFTPIAGVAAAPSSLVISAKVPATNMKELGAWLRANPDKANYGVPAMGSVPQFSGFLVGRSLGVDMSPVQYRGGGPMATDLIGGQIPMGFSSASDFVALHREGRVRILAVAGTKRAASLPEVPTYEEQGIAGLTRLTWSGIIGPAGLPPAFVQRFTTAVAKVLQRPDVPARMARFGSDADYQSPAGLREWISGGLAHWGAVIKDAKFEPQ